MKRRTTRRTFIGMMGSLAGALAAGVGLHSSRAGAADTQPTAGTGERFGDFLVLPWDAPLPNDVRPTGVAPTLEGDGATPSSARDRSVTDARSLADATGLPIYSFSSAPAELRGPATLLIRNKHGQVATASVQYESFNEALDTWVRSVDVTSSEVFLWPVPVWASRLDDVVIPPENVAGLPSPAILTTTALGYIVQWVEKQTLITVRAENNPTRDNLDALLGTIVRA